MLTSPSMENTFLVRIVINLGKTKENQLNFQVRKIFFVTNVGKQWNKRCRRAAEYPSWDIFFWTHQVTIFWDRSLHISFCPSAVV